VLVADKASGPAVVQRLKGENEAGELAIHYRDQRVGFRELKASAALDERRSAAPSPILLRSLFPAANHPWRKGFSAKVNAGYSGAA
jgi:hypothetical protein